MASASFTKTSSIKRHLTGSYQVVHATPGRIRLRIPKIASHPTYASNLERSLKALSFVVAVTMNLRAMSVTIQYKVNHVCHTTIKEKIALAIQQANAPMIAPQSTSALAKRLGVSLQALNGRRSRVDFAEWCQARDPEAIAWSYDADAKVFRPMIEVTSSAVAPLPQIMFQTVGATAGGKVGSLVGKLAGEVIGLIFLGSAGVVVGAEVGAFVGEVVGVELGTML